MTYDEVVEVAEFAFDEYLPKAGPATARKAFVDALLSELEERGALNLEDELPDEDYSEDLDEA